MNARNSWFTDESSSEIRIVPWSSNPFRVARTYQVDVNNSAPQWTRYYWLLLAEGHLNRRQIGAMVSRIALLPIPMG